MAKIKGWKKKRDNSKFETWVRDFTKYEGRESYIELEKHPATKKYSGSFFFVTIFENGIKRYKQNFFNYIEAKKLALKYMKNHPGTVKRRRVVRRRKK